MTLEANYTVQVDEDPILNEGESMVRRRRVFWLALVSIVIITGIISIVVSQSKQSNSNRTDLYGNYFECIVFQISGTSLNRTHTKDHLLCKSSNSMYWNTSMVKITGNASEFFAGRDFLRNEIKLRFPMSIINERREIDVDFSKNSIEIVETFTVRELSDLSHGVKKMLVVSVSGRDERIAWTKGDLAKAYFSKDSGISGHLSRCSDNKLSLTPVTGTDHKDGVLEVEIKTKVCGMHFWKLTELVNRELPSDTLNRNPHVSYVIPDCVDLNGGDGYGMIRGKESWMKSKAIAHPAFGSHEFGHNIGFQHSGIGSDKYADGSCIMGGQSKLNSQKMCFNAHKTWLSQWFSDYHEEINPSSKAFSGNLVGINDIISKNSIEATDISVLRIKGGSLNLYLMFNRQEGVNNDVIQYGDEVVIVGAKSSFDVSYVQGSIGSSNKVFEKKKWFNGKSLFIELCEMKKGKPDRASIIVYVDGPTIPKCDGNGSPPSVPVPKPTRKPTRKPVSSPPSSNSKLDYKGCFKRTGGAIKNFVAKKKNVKSPAVCSTFCDQFAGSKYKGRMLLTAGKVCWCIKSDRNPGIEEKESRSSKCSSKCRDGSDCGANSDFVSLYEKSA